MLIACVTIPRLLWQLAVAAQPDLARYPLVIAYVGDRAVVLDHCVRAAAHGVQVGQLVWEARRRCPALRVTTVPPEQITITTAQVLHVLHQHADTITPEANHAWMLPLVALGAGFRAAPQIAHQIQHDLHAATSLHSAIVLSRQRSVAGILAHTLPPGTVRVILPGDEAAALAPLSVQLLPGIGPRTAARLAPLGVHTIGQLAAIPAAVLLPVLGPRAHVLAARARGQDSTGSREIPATRHATWRVERACADARRLQAGLYLLAEQIGRDLRQQDVGSGRLTVQIALSDGRTLQRAVLAHARLDLDHDLAQLARQALAALQQETRLAVCAMTLHADDLGPRQVDLFADDDRLRQRQQAVDQIKARYGPQAITVAALLPQRQRAA